MDNYLPPSHLNFVKILVLITTVDKSAVRKVMITTHLDFSLSSLGNLGLRTSAEGILLLCCVPKPSARGLYELTYVKLAYHK